MSVLKLLVRLSKHKIPLNHAKILLFIKENPACLQKEMFADIAMSKNVLSTVMQLLIAKRWVIQNGTHPFREHSLGEKGEAAVKLILEEV